jgi:hypothetical protein
MAEVTPAELDILQKVLTRLRSTSPAKYVQGACVLCDPINFALTVQREDALYISAFDDAEVE